MKTSLLATGIVLALGSTAVHASTLLRAERPIANQYIVVLKSDLLAPPVGIARAGALRAATENAAVDLAARFDVGVSRVYGDALSGFVVRGNEQQIGRLMRDPRVAFVEEDGEVSIDATQSGATWGLDRIDQRDRPLNGTYIYDYTASNVRAYIIDTGILNSHSQFGGRASSG